MLQLLDGYQWKGKMIDCEAFLLACPHCDKVDQNKLKDGAFKNMGEAKVITYYMHMFIIHIIFITY